MAIRTEDCVKAISDYFNSLADGINWKRISKRSLPGGLTKRTFMSRSADEVIDVTSDEDKIYSVEPVNIGFRKKVDAKVCPDSVGLLSKIKDIILRLKKDGEYITMHSVSYEIEFGSLPEVVTVDGTKEDLDFENFELLDITDSSVRISAGGDWQEPLEFTASYKADGKLYYNGDATPGYRTGMSTQDLIIKVFGMSNPKELENADVDLD